MGGMTSLLLLLLAGVTVSTLVDLQKRVINGQDCDKKERLYHVKLLRNDHTKLFLCGGSLIRDQWILTAAHCWEANGLIAVLGVHPGDNQEEFTITTKETFKDGKKYHDIMLLKLPRTPEPATFQEIELPDCDKNPTPQKGANVQIAGFAGTQMHLDRTRVQDRPPKLQCADIEVDDCLQPLYHPDQFAFCGKTEDASSTPIVDVCFGDSGGGVEYNGKIYGVISNTAIKACTEPVEFVDVCKYMTWIKSKTKKTVLDKVKECLNCG